MMKSLLVIITCLLMMITGLLYWQEYDRINTESRLGASESMHKDAFTDFEAELEACRQLNDNLNSLNSDIEDLMKINLLSEDSIRKLKQLKEK